MFSKSIPSLLVTFEDTKLDSEIIQKGCLDSGRVTTERTALHETLAKGEPIERAHMLHRGDEALVKSEPSGPKKLDPVSKALAFVIELGALNSTDPAEAELSGTHGEQFSDDADEQVVEMLTSIEKIDLKTSPTHNPSVVPGNPAGHALVKGGPGSGPKKLKGDFKSHIKGMTPDQLNAADQSLHSSYRDRSDTKGAGVRALREHFGDVHSETTKGTINAVHAMIEGKLGKSDSSDLDHDALMAKAMNWNRVIA